MGQTIINGTSSRRVQTVSQPIAADDGRLRVAFLTPGLGRGGAERWIVSLCRWMQPELNVIGIVSSSHGGPWEALRPEAERWSPVYLMHPDRTESDAVLRTADIIIVWGFAAMQKYLPDGVKARVVYVAHGSGSWTAEHVVWAEPWVHHWAAVSNACRCAFPERLRNAVEVIHNGADIERVTPIRGREATRRAWGLQDDQIAVTYMGRFSPEKRPHALADTIAQLPKHYVGIMAGDGWQEAEARGYCQRVAGDRIKFVGFTPHVGDVLAASDFWFNVSPAEGFSLSLIEAWLAGVACISTPTGALPELQAEHGPLVIEVSIGAGALTIAAELLTAESQAVERITRNAQRLAWDQFTSAAMGYRWIEYLKGIA